MTRTEQRAARLARARRYIARHEAGETLVAIGASEGISHQRVGKIMECGGYVRSWRCAWATEEQYAVVFSALARGLSNGAAAREAGVTPGVVAGLRHRRGFTKRHALSPQVAA